MSDLPTALGPCWRLQRRWPKPAFLLRIHQDVIEYP